MTWECVWSFLMAAKKSKSTSGNHKTVVFNVRLARDVIAKLKVRAQAEHRTMTNLVQLLIDQGLGGT